MDDDIHAAAERLQGFLADPGSIFLPDDIELDSDIIDAVETILDAYLARADGERDETQQVTPEWMDEIGIPEKPGFRYERFYSIHGDSVGVTFTAVQGGWDSWIAGRCGVTRSDVRDLCRVYGVPVGAEPDQSDDASTERTPTETAWYRPVSLKGSE